MHAATRLLSLATLALALSACQGQTEQQDADTGAPAAKAADAVTPTHRVAPTMSRWQCGELDVGTRFEDAALETMIVEVSGQKLTLHAKAGEDGARFEDDAGNQFWSRPGNSTLTLAGQNAVSCLKHSVAAR